MINRTIRLLETKFEAKYVRIPVTILRVISRLFYCFLNFYGRFVLTPWNLRKYRGRSGRRLEIGPGPQRIAGFETVNIYLSTNVDYVADASRPLPFASNTFELIYASHVLEHVPWYRLTSTLSEWVRLLESGGQLEVWVPDGLKIAREFVLAEDGAENDIHLDDWYKFNEEKDPCLWMNGRTFSYGDGHGTPGDPNWHLALFSPRYLQSLMIQVGLQNVVLMQPGEARGYDHGWINLGFRGTKPS